MSPAHFLLRKLGPSFSKLFSVFNSAEAELEKMASSHKDISQMPISSYNIENTSVKEEKRQKKTSREVEIQTDVSTLANPFNMTARNFPKRHRNYLRTSSSNRTRGNSFSPGKALDLVRTALQPSLNAELESVLKSYQELFKLAAGNIKENTGELVSDEQVNITIRKALEEAKLLFKTDNRPTVEKPEKESRTSSPIVHKKRRQRNIVKDDGVSLPKSAKQEKNIHYEWDPDCINYETEFVMGVKANKALGFAATRGKLYYRHPDLFRYVGDQEDKQWLFENGHLPITGGKAFLMIKDNIYNLAYNHADYKESENTNLNEIQCFKVSKRLVDKMKVVMRRTQLHRDKDSKRDTTIGEVLKVTKPGLGVQASATVATPITTTVLPAAASANLVKTEN